MIDAQLPTPVPETIAFLDDYRPTSLIELPALARQANVARVFVKMENERPLGNFKVLGGMIAGLRGLERATRENGGGFLPRLICASDGNHGLAVAAAARRVHATASVYLPKSVSRVRADRIKAFGGDVHWMDGTYDDAVCAAQAAAARGEGILVADTTSDPDDVIVRDVMTGYGLLAQELDVQLRDELTALPSHVFVQAGVGGLAAALTQGLQGLVKPPARFLIVEPAHAACVASALVAGRPVRIGGDLKTSAEMLSCGLASAAALEVLLRHDARSVVATEDQLLTAVSVLKNANGPDTTPSGAAGLAGLLHVALQPELRVLHQLDAASNVLLIVTEGFVAHG